MSTSIRNRWGSAVASSADTSQRPIYDLVLLAFRLVIGLMFGLHALMAFGALGGVDEAGTAAPWGSMSWWTGVIESVGAALIVTGLFIRPTAFVLSGVMAFAYFTVHAPLGWNPLQNMGEQAALYCWIFLLLCVTGAGRYVLDRLRSARIPTVNADS